MSQNLLLSLTALFAFSCQLGAEEPPAESAPPVSTTAILQIRPEPEEREDPPPVTDAQRTLIIEKLKKRLGAQSGSFIWTPAGEDRIRVDMPGVTFEQFGALKPQFQKVAKLEFRLVKPGTGDVDASSDTEPGYVIFPYADDPEKALIVRGRPFLSGDRIVKSTAYEDPSNGSNILIEFDEKGTLDLAEFTKKNTDERFAIILDGEILLAPKIMDPITGGSSVISGRFTLEEAKNLATLLETPLGDPLVILEVMETAPPPR